MLFLHGQRKNLKTIKSKNPLPKLTGHGSTVPGHLQLPSHLDNSSLVGYAAPADGEMHGLRQVFACSRPFLGNICVPSLVGSAI